MQRHVDVDVVVRGIVGDVAQVLLHALEEASKVGVVRWRCGKPFLTTKAAPPERSTGESGMAGAAYEQEFSPEDLEGPREFTAAQLEVSANSPHSPPELASYARSDVEAERRDSPHRSPPRQHPEAAIPAAPPSRRPAAPPSLAAEHSPVLSPQMTVIGSRNGPLDAALAAARKARASDIHMQAGQPVRIRVAGALRPTGSPIANSTIEATVLPWLSPRQREQLEREGYTDLAVNHEHSGRLRVNIGRGRAGLKVSMRMIAQCPPTLEELRMPESVRKLEQHHQGLAIFSGPSGHGKTTSMAAVINMFNRSRPTHIITVEDPVEIVHPVSRAIISQREVGSHTASFHRALKGALREDPDIIAIGELRDRETVEMALPAAETGHLVVATMSTPSAAKTLGRLIDMFPPDDQEQVRATLAGALKLIVSQRLMRTKSGDSMVAAYETLVGSVALWSLIRDNKLFQLPSLLQRGKAYGMVRLEDSLRELVDAGLVDRQEAARFGGDKSGAPELKMAANE